MKCYCYETEEEFIYCVERAETAVYENLLTDPYWKKTDDDKFVKIYPISPGADDNGLNNNEYRELVKRNFERLSKSWLSGVFDWKNVMLFLAQRLAENSIEWYVIGSISEVLLGAEVKPGDIDICVHTRDFYRAKELFAEYTVEPFVDTKGGWIVKYFGKLCVDGASVDIAADDKMNMENLEYACEEVSWNGYDISITPLQFRYEVEKQRGRTDRIKAIEEYMCHNE